jgi:hypothetical protein
MNPSSIACRIEYVWNGCFNPSAPNRPNVSSVFGFGVAVNAKNDRFFCFPRDRALASSAASGSPASSANSSDASASASASSPFSTDFSCFTASPDVEECASSTITANRRPTTPDAAPAAASSAAIAATTGNFCSVVMMIRAALPSRAAFNWAEFSSIRAMVPGVWSKPATVSRSWRSSTVRSVITTTLSNTG